MKLIKTASGKRRIRISRKEWENIGRKAQWMQEEMEDVLGGSLEEYQDEFEKPTYPTDASILNDYGLSDILLAIKSLGEESIAGFSNVQETEVAEVLSTCELYELGEIKNWLQKNRRPKKQPLKQAQVDQLQPLDGTQIAPDSQPNFSKKKKKKKKSQTVKGK